MFHKLLQARFLLLSSSINLHTIPEYVLIFLYIAFSSYVKKNVASNNVELLERKNKELTELVQKVEHDTSSFNIDEVVVTTAPLYNQ